MWVSFRGAEAPPPRLPHNSNTGWHPTAGIHWELSKGRGGDTDLNMPFSVKSVA